MDLTPYLSTIFLVLISAGLLYALLRTAGEAALIRLADQEQGATIWKVWKDWRSSWRHGGFLSWSSDTWRLIGINLAAMLPALPVGLASLAIIAIPMWRELFSGEAIPLDRWLVAGSLALLVLAIASIPLSVLGVFVRMAQRAALLEDCSVMAALRRSFEVTGGHFQDVFVLWLLLGTFRLLYSLVIFPLVTFLAIAGMLLAWLVGAGVFVAVERLVVQQTAFLIAIVMGGLVFLVVLLLPMSFIDGLMTTYISVSWTRTYRKLISPAGLPRSGPSAAQSFP